jgi:hypothetical protein
VTDTDAYSVQYTLREYYAISVQTLDVYFYYVNINVDRG